MTTKYPATEDRSITFTPTDTPATSEQQNVHVFENITNVTFLQYTPRELLGPDLTTLATSPDVELAAAVAWYTCLAFALLGGVSNGVLFIGKFRSRNKRAPVHNIWVANLSATSLMLSLGLVFSGVDKLLTEIQKSYPDFIYFTPSVICSLEGHVSLVGAEAMCFFQLLVAIERSTCLTKPAQVPAFSVAKALLYSTALWLAAILSSILPLCFGVGHIFSGDICSPLQVIVSRAHGCWYFACLQFGVNATAMIGVVGLYSRAAYVNRHQLQHSRMDAMGSRQEVWFTKKMAATACVQVALWLVSCSSGKSQTPAIRQRHRLSAVGISRGYCCSPLRTNHSQTTAVIG